MRPGPDGGAPLRPLPPRPRGPRAISQSGGDWLRELERQLNEGMDAFLRANPEQQDLLQEQESRNRRQRLMEQRRRLRGRPGAAGRGPHRRADGGGPHPLDSAAGAGGALQPGGGAAGGGCGVRRTARGRRGRGGASLEDDWAAFEARQKLEELRRRMAR